MQIQFLKGPPLLLQAIRALPLPNPVGIALSMAVLFGLLVLGRQTLPIQDNEYRQAETLIALLMLVILGYFLFAGDKLLRRDGVQTAIDTNPRRHLLICLLLCFVSSIFPLIEQAEHEYFPYNATLWSWEVAWHRILTLVIGWHGGSLIHAMYISARLQNRHIEQMPQFDLFDGRAAQPAIQEGLANSLLVLGTVAIFSPFLVDARYYVMIGAIVVIVGGLSAIALLMPMIGYRKRAASEKNRELDRVAKALSQAREALWEQPDNPHHAQLVASLSQYRNDVEAVREWPFDRTTFARYGLYLLLPIGSWLGGAIVEALLERSL